MRANSRNRLLSLPILLSFNELGWIAVFAMALFWFHLLSHRQDDRTWEKEYRAATNEVRQLQLGNLTYSNEVARLTAEAEVQSNLLAQARRDLRDREVRLADAAARLARAAEELERLRDREKQEPSRLAILEQELADARNVHEELRLRLAGLEEEKRRLQEKLAQSTTGQAGIRQELVGLRGGVEGRMKRVVFLLDRSASMAEGNRWEDALQVIRAWLKHLPVEECALVTFNDRPMPFPRSGGMLTVGSDETARENLLAQVSRLRPAGHTATLDAFKAAYGYPGLDTIIFFTDGEPYVPGGVKASAQSEDEAQDETQVGKAQRQSMGSRHMDEVLRLVSQRAHIPVNVVALGSYFQKRQSDFLLELARRTGGAFIGR